MKRTILFNLSGYSGWDVWLSFLPRSWQVKAVARAALKYFGTGGKPMDLSETHLVIQTQWGSYRVVDPRGKVEPCQQVKV